MKFSTKLMLANFDGKEKRIIVKEQLLKPYEFIVGFGLIIGGVLFMTRRSFKNGAIGFDKAEVNTMVDLGIIKGVEKCK